MFTVSVTEDHRQTLTLAITFSSRISKPGGSNDFAHKGATCRDVRYNTAQKAEALRLNHGDGGKLKESNTFHATF